MNKERRKEVDHYEEIAKELVLQIRANIADQNYIIKPLIGEIGSALRTLIANGYDAGSLLKEYSKTVHKLHLDIAILIECPNTNRFELVIFEIKKVSNLGLNELSQLIGYCLVSRSRFGVLMNVDKAISRDFSIILDADEHLTHITRLINQKEIQHEIGVMVWNSKTEKVEYTQSGAVRSIPELANRIHHSLKNGKI
jgi:hypothetical protein